MRQQTMETGFPFATQFTVETGERNIFLKGQMPGNV
jgi:hypothetical protein